MSWFCFFFSTALYVLRWLRKLTWQSVATVSGEKLLFSKPSFRVAFSRPFIGFNQTIMSSFLFSYKCIRQSLEDSNRCPKCNYIIDNVDQLYPNFLGMCMVMHISVFVFVFLYNCLIWHPQTLLFPHKVHISISNKTFGWFFFFQSENCFDVILWLFYSEWADPETKTEIWREAFETRSSCKCIPLTICIMSGNCLNKFDWLLQIVCSTWNDVLLFMFCMLFIEWNQMAGFPRRPWRRSREYGFSQCQLHIRVPVAKKETTGGGGYTSYTLYYCWCNISGFFRYVILYISGSFTLSWNWPKSAVYGVLNTEDWWRFCYSVEIVLVGSK